MPGRRWSAAGARPGRGVVSVPGRWWQIPACEGAQQS
jgi:hypothetical protein